jgi:hypothetical protein
MFLTAESNWNKTGICNCNFSQGGGETELVSGVYTFSLNQIEKQTRKEKKVS